MSDTHDSPIPTSEFADRVAAMQAFAAEHDLGAIAAFSAARTHIWYQTGHVSYVSNWSDRDRHFDTMVVVPVTGPPALLIAGLPYIAEKARGVSWMTDLRVVGAPDPRAAALPGLVRTFGTEVRDFMRERGLAGRKVGLLGVETMSVPVHECLVQALGDVAVRLEADVVADLRCRKSPAEIALMRQAARLSDLGYQTLVEVAEPGVPGYEIVAEMERVLRRAGADLATFWMASGPATCAAIPLPDIRPHRRKLGQGDQITCCSYVVYEGYWAHAMRSGSLGEPSTQQRRLFDPCLAVHRATLAAMKPGVSIADIVGVCRARTEAAGMELHSLRIGHGIGLDYGEQPYISDVNAEPLAPGMTIEIHAQAVIPGMGGFYVPLGDVCLVTDDGVEPLTKFPLELFEA